MLIRLSLFLVILNTLDQTQGFLNEIKVKKLDATTISQDDFTVTWQHTDDGDSYTVELNNPIPGCNETFTVSCKDPDCSFTLSEHECSTQPCTDVDITVKTDETTLKSKFNTAPVVTELDTSLACEINGTIANISWNSEKFTNEGSKCATRAQVKIKIGGVTSGVIQILETEDDQTNYAKVDLDPCDTGTVTAYVTYLSGVKNYTTSATNDQRADGSFPGVGIGEPPEVIQDDDFCSIQASWQSVCDKIDDYRLKWDDEEGINGDITLGGTSYTIPDLKPGNYNVCVLAKYLDNPIGEELCTEAYLPQDCVNPTTTIITTTTTRITTEIETSTSETSTLYTELPETETSTTSTQENTASTTTTPGVTNSESSTIQTTPSESSTIQTTPSATSPETTYMTDCTGDTEGPPSPTDEPLSDGAIAGIVIGCLVGVALIAAGIFFMHKKKILCFGSLGKWSCSVKCQKLKNRIFKS